MENLKKIDEMEKGVKSTQTEKVQRATFTANPLKHKITKSNDECRRTNVRAQPRRTESNDVEFWIPLVFYVIWIYDAIQRWSEAGDLGAKWYVYFLPIYYKTLIFWASMFTYVAILFKKGRKFAAVMAMVKFIVAMLLLVNAIVNVFHHPEFKVENEILNESIKNYRGNILFKYFAQLVLMAYINFYGLPRLCKSE